MVKCRLCGKEFAILNSNHLKPAHGIDFFEYRRMFPDAPTCSEELSCKLSGQTRTEEQKENISRGISEDARQRIRESNKGNKGCLGYLHSEEALRKIREAHLGKTHSEATKRLIGESSASRTASEETRQKMREAHTGITKSAETRQLLSESRKESWKDPEYQQKQKDARNLKPTEPEVFVQRTLDKHFPGEWKYVGDYQFRVGGRNPDFLNVNGKKQVIEVFGMFWHEESEEEERIAHYKKLGFDCLVIWEYDSLDEDLIVEGIKNLGA